jgi:protein subunit release factor A
MSKIPLVSVTKDDLEIQTFRCGGKGGQHQNKTESGVRIIHPPSGVTVESREERSQAQNKAIAFKRLTSNKKFILWLKMESARKMGILEDIDRTVDRMMKPTNIKTEVREDDRWVEEKISG